MRWSEFKKLGDELANGIDPYVVMQDSYYDDRTVTAATILHRGVILSTIDGTPIETSDCRRENFALMIVER